MINKIEKICNHTFKDKSIIKQAFIHSSYANEHKTISNERLEFLGDAILEFVITDELYKNFNLNEGKLTKYRASLVNEDTLSFVISELKLQQFLLRGKGESKFEVTKSEMCDLFESIVGALYLDGGLSVAKQFILSNLKTAIDGLKKDGVLENSKTMLQEMLPKEKIKYSTTKHGEDHNPTYKSTVIINGVNMGFGEGPNKKTAELLAAKNTINMIKKA